MQTKLGSTERGLALVMASVILWIGVAAGPARGAPVVLGITGTFVHKATIAIAGKGFRPKPTAAPLVWDDATGNNILEKWDGAWPSRLTGYNTGYYDPMRGVTPPHSHDKRYIAGAHAGHTGYDAGYNVVFFKNISLQPFPFYIYASWYQRADDNWVFGGDNNYKTFAYSICCSPYELPNDWFTAYGPPHPGSTDPADRPQWLYTDNGSSLENPDANGHNAWWNPGVNPMAGEWAKVEIAIRVTNQSDGYIKVWENGIQKMNYVGSTDKYEGNRRTIGIGGFARMAATQNWRYFADAYLDISLARVVLADSPTLSQANIIENQIPISWNDESITATVNLGRFAQGRTAYLFVVDSTGTPSAGGVAVTTGGEMAIPNSPAGVSVK